jgi:hypothetical protein
MKASMEEWDKTSVPFSSKGTDVNPKFEARNPKQIQMTKIINSKQPPFCHSCPRIHEDKLRQESSLQNSEPGSPEYRGRHKI